MKKAARNEAAFHLIIRYHGFVLYCFVEEDIRSISSSDPMTIQAEYAKHLGRYCCCRFSDGMVIDHLNQPIEVKSKLILLRATCQTVLHAVEILERQGAVLLESAKDIHMVEHWYRLPITKRKIFSITSAEIICSRFPPQFTAFLSSTPRVFVKSSKKGFSIQIPSRRILEGDPETLAFFKEHCNHYSEELLVSDLLEIVTDSLGKKESRHFVINGTILNSSRMVHSLKHAVPQSLLEGASSLVKIISTFQDFPRNYVLDVCQYTCQGNREFETVELNPISTSLCYVNNSIFSEAVQEIESYHTKTGMGFEFCYDAMKHSNRYVQNRQTNEDYSYSNTEQYFMP